ncbi:MAG: Lrp/AsnC family transcriptional regulator [Rhodospirillales bacterium]
MDRFDRRILSYLQSNARLTAEKLGDLVGLSPAAVQKRVKKLRDTEVIQREIAVLDPDKLGQKVTVVVEVNLSRETVDVLDRFKRSMRAAPQVQQCYYTTGEVDFILVVVVKDMSAYEAFTQEYFFSMPQIEKFKSSVVMDRVKADLSISVEE